MKNLRKAGSVVLFSLWASSVFGQDARAIVQKAEDHARGKSSMAELTIVTTRPKWTRSMEVKTWMKGTDYAMILVKAPAKEKGTAFLKRKKEVWNWLPNLERNIKLPPSMMAQSWMGTDFTNDDLVKEASAVDDYAHELLGEESRGGRDCYKILMRPKPEAAIIWEKVLVWIDKKDYIQMRTEFYDDTGELVNVMQASDIKVLGGRLLPSRLLMEPQDKKGHSTEIIYKALAFDKPMGDEFFTTANMARLER